MKLLKLKQRKERLWIFSILLWTVISLFVIAGLIYITHMPDNSYSGSFRALSPSEQFLRDRLENHVLMLAEIIGERNIWNYSKLEASADYIETTLADFGYKVKTQEFKFKDKTVRNLEVEITGISLPEEIVLIGAHYDSVIGSPGANDNASGVAALLEIARLFAKEKPSRTIRLVAFVNEEPPFFQTKDMGSRVYASRSRQRGEQITAMISLETIGFYSDSAGSQDYPFPFSLFYPNTGNFIGFVGNISSRELVHKAITIFRTHTAFPSEGIAAPEWITGIDWSDHWSFWKKGYPAIMITDTAPFRYKHYHKEHDTPDKIDYAHMSRATEGIVRLIRELSDTKM